MEDEKSMSRLCHNHELVQSQAESLKNPNMRAIPPQYDQYATTLKEANLSPSKIYHFLVQKCIENKMEVTFTESDVMNKYGGSAQQNILDCTNLIEHLKEREMQDPELEYRLTLDLFDGSPARIFLS